MENKNVTLTNAKANTVRPTSFPSATKHVLSPTHFTSKIRLGGRCACCSTDTMNKVGHATTRKHTVRFSDLGMKIQPGVSFMLAYNG